ncbi:sensor histidine kinase [Streptosporangium canum]|uniref:sensor histidine kinase n=1 Tax=Streptosporangium canum TaxID=324952 RepID=UPI0036D11B29
MFGDGCPDIICEALVNVARHAAATTCEIRLTEADGALEVKVVDDGCGLSLRATPGIGPAAMQECIRELGGRGAVTARAGGDTRVHALFPVDMAARRAL